MHCTYFVTSEHRASFLSSAAMSDVMRFPVSGSRHILLTALSLSSRIMEWRGWKWFSVENCSNYLSRKCLLKTPSKTKTDSISISTQNCHLVVKSIPSYPRCWMTWMLPWPELLAPTSSVSCPPDIISSLSDHFSSLLTSIPVISPPQLSHL